MRTQFHLSTGNTLKTADAVHARTIAENYLVMRNAITLALTFLHDEDAQEADKEMVIDELRYSCQLPPPDMTADTVLQQLLASGQLKHQVPQRARAAVLSRFHLFRRTHSLFVAIQAKFHASALNVFHRKTLPPVGE